MQVEFWGHRGSETDGQVARAYGRPGHPAENTIAAFRQALDEGATGIELDVMCSRDLPEAGHKAGDVLVVTHSNDLSRHVFRADGTPDASHGFVADCPVAELKALRVGADRKGEIPTLNEVMQFLHAYRQETGRDITLNIELKDVKGTHYAEVERVKVGSLVAQALSEGPLPRDAVILSSFDVRDLVEVAKADPRLRLGMLFYGRDGQPAEPLYPAARERGDHLAFTPDNLRSVAAQLAAVGGKLTAVHPEMGDLSTEALRLAAEQGWAVNPWFLGEAPPSQRRSALREGLALARQAGVREMHLITNFPAALREVVGTLASSQENAAQGRQT